MTIILIILLILAIIYLYYQNRKLSLDNSFGSDPKLQTELVQTKQAQQALITFLKTNLNSNSLEELKTKLNQKTLNELLEQNEDYETEIDTLTRTKNSLEADLLAQSNAYQARLKEKDREVKRIKEDLTEAKKAQSKLTSEKQQHKGSLERIKLLTEQITNLEKESQQTKQQHTEHLRSINLLFDPQAKDYQNIDFNGLYALLTKIAQKDLPGSFPEEKKDD